MVRFPMRSVEFLIDLIHPGEVQYSRVDLCQKENSHCWESAGAVKSQLTVYKCGPMEDLPVETEARAEDKLLFEGPAYFLHSKLHLADVTFTNPTVAGTPPNGSSS